MALLRSFLNIWNDSCTKSPKQLLDESCCTASNSKLAPKHMIILFVYIKLYIYVYIQWYTYQCLRIHVQRPVPLRKKSPLTWILLSGFSWLKLVIAPGFRLAMIRPLPFTGSQTAPRTENPAVGSTTCDRCVAEATSKLINLKIHATKNMEKSRWAKITKRNESKQTGWLQWKCRFQESAPFQEARLSPWEWKKAMLDLGCFFWGNRPMKQNTIRLFAWCFNTFQYRSVLKCHGRDHLHTDLYSAVLLQCLNQWQCRSSRGLFMKHHVPFCVVSPSSSPAT